MRSSKYTLSSPVKSLRSDHRTMKGLPDVITPQIILVILVSKNSWIASTPLLRAMCIS